MTDKETLIGRILEIELEMFLGVPARRRSSCQDYPDSFRLHRKAQFVTWSVRTLASYLRDVERAKGEGRNLMTRKYARMEDLIPPESRSPEIDEILGDIVRIQFEWQREMAEEYPHLMRGSRPLSSAEDSASATSFETYLRGELESYSDETLSLLHEDTRRKLDAGLNLSKEVYTFLVKEMGYSSLEEAEQRARRLRDTV